ncbi:hypothetical protein [Halomicrococcus sp. SG-WS-1]|uniref:hypothetical protein n=1 Tax=Halomicrococcus sp. SG-WS-1 TaxID=3439057 RepID=UPI003F7A4DDD
MNEDCQDSRSRAAKRLSRESNGHHDGIPVQVGEFTLQQNVHPAVKYSDGDESVYCRRVDGQWQALAVEDGRTRTLLRGLGSKNHALWLAREYMEFGRTYDDPSIWSDLPARERSNPFQDLLRASGDAPRF